MNAASSARGQPLLVLGGLLVAWLALRMAVWQPAFDTVPVAAPPYVEALPFRSGGPAAGSRFALLPDPLPHAAAPRIVTGPEAMVAYAPRPGLRSAAPPHPLLSATIAPARPAGNNPDLVRVALGHSLLLAAGLSQMNLPPLLAAYLQQPPAPGRGVPAGAPALAGLPQHVPSLTGSRLSADAWLMVRQDTTSSVVSGRPSYGRSQAGGVVRYRLAPSSPHGPQAYLRANSALEGALEKDLAIGLSARLAPSIPLRFAAEARISETDAGTELRPAVFAVTEFPPLDLPRGLRAEAYVQAGYAGGRFATAFVDGQGRVERPVARLGKAEVTAGAGAWGGAQEGAARLDIGPTAAVSFRLGEARGRVAADYRFRVAGEAEPKSGPALTLSAGF